MTPKLLDALATVTVDIIKQALEPMKARNAQLEQRIKELEARPLLKYLGVWRDDATYTEGQLVTHAGGLWLATTDTTGTPSTPASGWRLIVKRGQA
jgi:hypothetical protein